MKKVMAALITGVLLMTLSSAQVVGAKKRKPKKVRQQVEGAVLVPAGAENNCLDLVEGWLQFYSQESWPTGMIAYRFDVDTRTGGKPFRLESDDPEADFDIRFYEKRAADAPLEPPASATYASRGPGGETGLVPPTYEFAMICLYEGQNANFTYKAGPRRWVISP